MKKLENTHLYQEIHQQPDIIRQLTIHKKTAIEELVKQIKKRKINQVFIAARGTSDNAGRYAQYLLGSHNRMVVSLAAPSLFTIYQTPPDLRNMLVLGISQSGKSPDIVSVVKEGRRQGALTAAITNQIPSDLSRAADISIDLQAGEEISLAATKTYTAQLTLLAILSNQLDPVEGYLEELAGLPDKVDEVFKLEDQVRKLVAHYRLMKNCVVIGRGFNYASAYEFSLKLKELTYTISEPYSSSDFLHGPIAVVDRGFPVFMIAPDGKMVGESETLINLIRKRQGEVVLISNRKKLLNLSDQSVSLPANIPEWLSPIPAIIPAQMFAMYLAEARSIDVDNPRGLKKVTETW